MIQFGADCYNDDRMFVLEVARCEIRDRGDSFIHYIVYHDSDDEALLWALVTLIAIRPDTRPRASTRSRLAKRLKRTVEASSPTSLE
jgi:hypothetical protein